jgi:hypothetical protein
MSTLTLQPSRRADDVREDKKQEAESCCWRVERNEKVHVVILR